MGYTNAGKSTLLNKLTNAGVLSEDKLFATLDPTTRVLKLPNTDKVLLTDTVGFIRKLPTQLIESFKSTLDEVREADLLVHVADISHESFEDHVNSVNEILAEIDSKDKPTVMVFNKIDNFSYIKQDEDDLSEKKFENYSLEDWKRTWMSKNEYKTLFISATENDNLEELRKTIYEEVKEIHTKRFPYNNFLFQYYDDEGVDEEETEE